MHNIALLALYTAKKTNQPHHQMGGEAETAVTPLQLRCRKIATADEGARKRKRTCSGVRGEELHPGSSSSTSSPFSLDRSVHILLWEKDNCAWIRRRPSQQQSWKKIVLPFRWKHARPRNLSRLILQKQLVDQLLI